MEELYSKLSFSDQQDFKTTHPEDSTSVPGQEEDQEMMAMVQSSSGMEYDKF